MAHIQAFVVTTLLIWAAVSVSGTTTELSTTSGDTVNIPCLFKEGPVKYIFWYFKNCTAGHKILFFVKGESTYGAEYANRTSLQKDNSTLSLRNITVADEGTYCCNVGWQGQKPGLNINTKLNVFSLRPDTLPVITPCTWVDESSSCSIHANHSFTLTCTLPNVYPVQDTELIWFQDGQRVSSTHDVMQNDDGTTDISRQIQVSETGNFTCDATYLSANGSENTAVSAEAWIKPPADVTNTTDKNLTKGAIVGIAMGTVTVMIVGIVGLCIYCRKTRTQCCSTKDEQNSEEVQPDHEEVKLLETPAKNVSKDENAQCCSTKDEQNSEEVQPDQEGVKLLETPAKNVSEDENAQCCSTKDEQNSEEVQPDQVTPTEDCELLDTSAENGSKQGNESSEPTERPTPAANQSTHEEVNSSNPPPLSTVTKEENVDRSDERKITDGEIIALAKLMPHRNYIEFCVALKFDMNYSKSILTKYQSNYIDAFEEILKNWSTKTGGFTQELDGALLKADLGGLISQYKKVN